MSPVQWLLQELEDNRKIADALDRMGIPYSWHFAFDGDLASVPAVPDPERVVVFGYYSIRRAVARHGWKPGVFEIAPFVGIEAWRPFTLNGYENATFMTVRELAAFVRGKERAWFIRPVEDSKLVPGAVKNADEIIELAERATSMKPHEIPIGALRPDTAVMLFDPVGIAKEWRVWIVGGKVVTYSLYKEGRRVVYRNEIDDDALAFARDVVNAAPDYSPAYVLDVCRTLDGRMRLLETNCINSAGFYAANVELIVDAIAAFG